MDIKVVSPPPADTATSAHCFHCNEACPNGHATPFRIEEKLFCCEGCKLVYEILNTHNLCDFYTTSPRLEAVKTRPPAAGKSYAYLDDDDIRQRLIEFEQGDTAQVTFYIAQMHCASCIWLLEHLANLDEGVTHARVNFLKKTVTIQFNTGQTSLRKLATLLHTIGYAPDINLNDVEGTSKPATSRRLAYQIGVAGFAFGNVMLFSFPEYVGMTREVDPWFSRVFGGLSILIALPVLLYSAQDYFISAWQGLRQRRLNIDVPLCLALLSLFGRSIWEIGTQTGAGYLDSFTGLTLLLLTGKWFQQRVWHQMSFERDFKSYFPVAATVRQGDQEGSVPVHRLVPGDIIVVRHQEVIPADGILTNGDAYIDYSFVTGESEPVRVGRGEKIFAGGKQMGALIEVSLTRRVAQSHLTQLWNNEAFKPTAKGQVTRLADAAGRYFTWLILVFGLGAVLYWGVWRGDAATAINCFTAVMIVACPCNIALSVPFTLGNIVRIMGKNQMYLKNIGVIEALAAVDTVIFDKTGTITEVAGRQGQWRQAMDWTWDEKIAIRSVVRQSNHPLSRQIYMAMPDVPVHMPEQYREITGQGIMGIINGSKVRVGTHTFVKEDVSGEATEGVGGVWVGIDGRVRGCFDTQTRFRTGLAQVLDFFRAKTASVWLLSGDHKHPNAELRSYFPDDKAIRMGQSPQDKLDFVRTLQQSGQKVMMLGDGLNDAGALRQSDVGVVIAEDTNNFTPACDAIVAASEFQRIPDMIRLARSGVRIVQYSYIVALTYNAIGLSFAVAGHLSPLVAAVLMPASSISIVLFGTGLGNWAARKHAFGPDAK
jgi:P-type Cu+ transporter